MITRETMIARIKALGNDAILVESQDVLKVTLDDFEGFDSDWNEIFRDYDNEAAVCDFLEMLEDTSIDSEEDLYTDYFFDGFIVRIGYSSFDI